MTKVNKPFGNMVTKENYLSLRNLALRLKMKDFVVACGFRSGVWDRLKRFPSFEKYKSYEKDNSIKYAYVNKKRNSKRVTVNDIYSKLETIEGKISDIAKDNNRHDLFALRYYYLNKRDTNGYLARGVLLDGERFLVFSESQARADHTKSFAGQKGALELKRQLMSEGVVSNSNNHNLLIFNKPYLFNSPSQAASLILGYPADGWDVWKDINGKKLHQERSEKINPYSRDSDLSK